MKFIFVLILLSGLFYYVIYPPVVSQKRCYDTAAQAITDISYFTASRGLSQGDICQRRTEVLLDLGDCIQKVTSSTRSMHYTGGIVDVMLSLVRPSAKGYQTMKSEHNTECAEYPTYQLE